MLKSMLLPLMYIIRNNKQLIFFSVCTGLCYLQNHPLMKEKWIVLRMVSESNSSCSALKCLSSCSVKT